MTKTLRISPNLELPLDYATSRNAILAMSGAGKSNLSVVLAEELHRAGVPWIAIDPKGDWYGIRSAVDGKGPGLDVHVLGGEFGDLPLSPRSGARVAELVAAGKLIGVLDVSDFETKADVSRFLTDFASTLLRKQRTPLHVFLEECDEYLPQGGRGGQLDPLASACVGAMKRLATKGRFRGIGYTMVSQRSAEVNKSVLYQCETLVAMRVQGPRDIEAVKDWISRAGKGWKEVLDSMPDLADGEAWIWSPQRLKLQQRVQTRRRQTFDSGKTPEIGKALVVPKLAKVDIEQLRQDFADFEEQAKADDPKELRAQLAQAEAKLRHYEASAEATVADLERQLKERPVVEPEQVEVPAFDAAMFAILQEEVQGALHGYRQRTEAAIEAFRRPPLMKVPPADPSCGIPSETASERAIRTGSSLPPRRVRFDSPFTPGLMADVRRSTPRVVHRDPKPANVSLGAGAIAILTTIAQYKDGVTREQIAVLTGYKATSRKTYLQQLRAHDCVEARGDRFVATATGRKALGPGFKPLPTGAALREHWLERLPEGERRILELAIRAYPRVVPNGDVEKTTGYKATSRKTYVQKLRARELVGTRDGGVVARPELF